MIKTTVHGFYPKIAEDPALPNYRRARNRLDAGEITAAEFNHVVQSTMKRVVDEQVQVGIDLPTDGQIQWDDLVSPFARIWKNTSVGGLIRFFDNNTYYRRAQIHGEIMVNTPAATPDFRAAQAATTRPLKAVLPGPLTFAKMSDDHHYGDDRKVVQVVAEALNVEALALQNAGCTQLQIDEPFLAKVPERAGLLRDALNIMLRDVNMKTTLAVYFDSLKPLVPELWNLPVNGFFLDCVSRPENLELALLAPVEKTVAYGIVNARNTGRETTAHLNQIVEQIESKRSGGDNWIGPSAALEFLPHADAQNKLRDLVSAAQHQNRR